ncbi:hypothetical protein BZA77DRAFT_284203 [Pyronema omphalodes]|nr:hypothetical protein BZA77DRAFT_284203 [Pyronema omphalodes]
MRRETQGPGPTNRRDTQTHAFLKSQPRRETGNSQPQIQTTKPAAPGRRETQAQSTQLPQAPPKTIPKSGPLKLPTKRDSGDGARKTEGAVIPLEDAPMREVMEEQRPELRRQTTHRGLAAPPRRRDTQKHEEVVIPAEEELQYMRRESAEEKRRESVEEPRGRGLAAPPRRLKDIQKPVDQDIIASEEVLDKRPQSALEEELQHNRRESVEDQRRESAEEPRGRGLAAPPRRLKDMQKPVDQDIVNAEVPERRRESAEELADHHQPPSELAEIHNPPQPPLPQQPPQRLGLNQKPRRLGDKAPSRRRISQILLERQQRVQAQQEAMTTNDDVAMAEKNALIAPFPVKREAPKGNEEPPRKRISARSPLRKSARLSDNATKAVVKKPPVPQQAPAPSQPLFRKPDNPAVRRSSRHNKRSADDSLLEDDHSFVSVSSGYSSAAPGELRLKKRVKTSLGSLPSPPSLTQEEEDELLPPAIEGLIPGPIRPKKRPLDPVLNDNIERVEMYEDSWLESQESAVSQLLNQLLSRYCPAPVGKDRLSLRREFLVAYGAAPFPMVYKRLSAALLFGTLSITQDFLEKSSVGRLNRPAAATSDPYCGWGHDVGTKRSFMTLLVGSYDRMALITALEVVVGREMFANAQPEESQRKILDTFIERYLIRSEDIMAQPVDKTKDKKGSNSEDEDRGTPAWFLRRTLLRTLMLILLLDKAKAGGMLGSQLLFQKESPHKSSLSILQALSKFLMPSFGDVSKPLSHLNYTLETVQPPLSEFDYSINNLATDLRDGVRLARIVEVLHSRSQTSLLSSSGCQPEEEWPLTPKLQFPANYRFQKTANVTLVLKYLSENSDFEHGIFAKDIIDGHREKTVGLLWTLLTSKGLDLLLDWDLVSRETKRLYKEEHMTEEEVKNGDYASLLKSWASVIAAKNGLVVRGWTGFADGRAFDAIVREYQQYLPSRSSSGSEPTTLAEKLKAIGCNSYFCNLFSSASMAATSRIFSPSFITLALSYLCSRLVAPSIMERAAMIIQRSFRHRKFITNLSQRLRLLILAHSAAEIVRPRLAAITIQRAYRAFLHKKIQNLIQYTTSIQTFSRGYLARQKLQREMNAVSLIQKRWRNIRDRRFQERIKKASQGLTDVQALIRGYLTRRDITEKSRAITIIGNWWHSILLIRQAQQQLQQLRREKAVTTIWHWWHNILLIREAQQQLQQLRREKAATTIANWWYGTLSIRRAKHQLNELKFARSVTVISHWWASILLTRRERSHFLSLRTTTIFLQQRRRETITARNTHKNYLLLLSTVANLKAPIIRRRLELSAATLIQRLWRQRSGLIKFRNRRKKIITLQCLIRGYLTRLASIGRIRIIHRRLASITPKPEETLSSRTKQALATLQGPGKIGIPKALQQLEEKAALSKTCAKIIVMDEKAFDALLGYIETVLPVAIKNTMGMAARSLASAVNILGSIAKVEALVAVVTAQMGPASLKRDTWNVLLAVVEATKLASGGTIVNAVFVSACEALVRFSMAVRRRLLVRKKWAERLREVVKTVEEQRRKRGAGVDLGRNALVAELRGLLGDEMGKLEK